MVFVVEWLDIRLFNTGLYQNFKKHLWKSHESYGIHPKKDQRGKEPEKIN